MSEWLFEIIMSFIGMIIVLVFYAILVNMDRRISRLEEKEK